MSKTNRAQASRYSPCSSSYLFSSKILQEGVYGNSNRIDIQDLKQAICPQEFYERELGTSIRARWGKKWCLAGLCPFHADRFAGSFYVNIESGAYKCHACGAVGGDVIAFIQKKHGYSFVEAIKLLNETGRI